MNRNLLSLLPALAAAAVIPGVLGTAFHLGQVWASTIGIVVALLLAYAFMRTRGRVTFGHWAATVALISVIALSVRALMR